MNESFLSLKMIDGTYTVLEMESIFVLNFGNLEVSTYPFKKCDHN
jgi:hypothetical protein